MRTATINRIANTKTLCIYVVVVVALIFMKGIDPNNSLIELLGGISNTHGGYGVNIFEIICWNVSVLPPISVSILFMMDELGVLSVYTIIRSKNIRHWWQTRFISVVAVNFLYSVVAVLIVWIVGSTHLGESIYKLMLLFSLHIITMSAILITVLVTTQSVHIVILVFAAIEIFGVVAGSLFPIIGKYTIAFWGMAKNSNYLLLNEQTHILIVSMAMLIITVCCYTISAAYLHKNNPVGNYRLKT